MKKILNKKVLGVLLAVMMLLSLSAPAFATAGTVNVTFDVDSEYYFDNDYVIVDGVTTLYDVINGDTDLEATWHNEVAQAVDQYGNSTPIYDGHGNPVIVKVLDSMMEAGTIPMGQDGLDMIGDTRTVYWSNYSDGYGFINTTVHDGYTWYNYIYVGYAWQFWVNDVYVETQYADQVVLNDGDEVLFDYHLVVHEWSCTIPLTNTFPYI